MDNPYTMLTAGRIPALYIDGICVHHLVEEVAASACAADPSLRTRLRFEVIEWEPICAAADRACLVETLLCLIRQASSVDPRGPIEVRAFASHGDCCVTFQVACTDHGKAGAVPPDDDAVGRCEALVQAMAGRMTVYQCTADGLLASFWLPQWVCAIPLEPDRPARAA